MSSRLTASPGTKGKHSHAWYFVAREGNVLGAGKLVRCQLPDKAELLRGDPLFREIPRKEFKRLKYGKKALA